MCWETIILLQNDKSGIGRRARRKGIEEEGVYIYPLLALLPQCYRFSLEQQGSREKDTRWETDTRLHRRPLGGGGKVEDGKKSEAKEVGYRDGVEEVKGSKMDGGRR